MSRNYEIKARLENREKTYSLALELATSPVISLHQKDIYFKVPQGRLKIRAIDKKQGELIYYMRPDKPSPKISNYVRKPLNDFAKTIEFLKTKFKIKNTVEKTREVILAKETRIHFDRIKSLGDFIELEVLLDGYNAFGEGKKRAYDIIKYLKIDKNSLLAGSYTDIIGKTK